jgi:hypothetical protein
MSHCAGNTNIPQMVIKASSDKLNLKSVVHMITMLLSDRWHLALTHDAKCE